MLFAWWLACGPQIARVSRSSAEASGDPRWSMAARLVQTTEARQKDGKPGQEPEDDATPIRRIDPPEQGFFAKVLDYHGIPIKAPAVVDDRALRIARARIARLLEHLPNALYNLTVAGAELHIIGKDQVTSDLPEHRHLKGKPFDGNLTVDQRTRRLGGLLTSCGEENLLELPTDRYRGRDICTHEFAHNVQDQGLSPDVQKYNPRPVPQITGQGVVERGVRRDQRARILGRADDVVLRHAWRSRHDRRKAGQWSRRTPGIRPGRLSPPRFDYSGRVPVAH